MRRDGDFAAYLAARWSRIVRCLVLLGGSPAEAERVTRAALARVGPGWDRARGSGDPDVHAWRAVLEAWRGRAWSTAPGPPGGDRVAALEPALDRLVPDARAALVLRAVGGLSDAQVAQVLERRPPRPSGVVPGEQELRDAADEIDVGPAPGTEALQGTRGPARRRAGMPVAILVLVLLVGTGTWAGTRPRPQPDPAAPRVIQQENPAEVAWWATNLLHLPHVAVELSRLEDLVEIGDGAVVADHGTVSYVADDGTVDRLGEKVPGTRVVASDEQGWAAWLAPGADGEEDTLVAFDLASRTSLARRPVPASPETGPIAFDYATLYFSTGDGEWAWPLAGDPQRLTPGGVVAVAAGTRVRQVADRRIAIDQSMFSISYTRTGTGAIVSPDGNWVLSRSAPGDATDRFGDVHVYDARTGERVWDGLDRSDLVAAASLGEDATITYVTSTRADATGTGGYLRSSVSGPYELRTCSIEDRTCSVVTTFPRTGARPVLPR